jgi:hypothetical protein
MNPRLPYHILNTIMIAGGVCFIFNMLNLVPFLMQFRIIHFLSMIGGAIFLKLVYGWVKPGVKDPMVSNQLASRFFYLGMAVLAVSILLRNNNLGYYQTLLYLDIALQLAALGISFSDKTPSAKELNEDVLDI